MGEPTPAPPMHFCHKCDKPFSNENSHNRHVRYCGSRARRRQRSCQACGIAKSRCSFETPCSRCLRKNIQCLYPDTVNASAAGTARREHYADSSESSPPVSTYTSSGNSSGPEYVAGQDFDRNATRAPLLADGNVYVVGPRIQPSPQHESDTTMVEVEQAHSPIGSLSSMTDNSQGVRLPAWCSWTLQGLSLARLADYTTVTTSSGHLIRREQTLAQHNADVVMQALRAFPTMMIRRETWPWFIHPHTHLLSKSIGAGLPDALSACMGIAQMYLLGTVETRPFVWQTVKTEYQRFADRLPHMSAYELLNATQACMIYFIMCILEDSPDDMVSTELLQVLNNLYRASKSLYGGHAFETEVINPSLNWTEWIFAESRRRLANLWLLVGSLIRVKTDTIYDSAQSHRNVALPAPKCLWEASSESAWRSEYEASRILQVSGLVYLGDLIDAQSLKDMPINKRKLDLWNASVDNLGVLLNLVCTMI